MLSALNSDGSHLDQNKEHSQPPVTGMISAMSWRLASWGITITGFLGWIFAINAALSNHYAGAGICLFASVAAFLAVWYTNSRRTSR